MNIDNENRPTNKGFYILPNLFTLASVLSAFYGITMAHEGFYNHCAIAILISAVLDGLDGKVARLTNTSSDFGVQLDSLADAIAFGLTPAYLIYFWQLHSLGRVGLAIAFLFVACGILRLARFNIMPTGASKKFFIGLPIPAAACALALLILFHKFLPKEITMTPLLWISFTLTLILALLMVSNVRYFAFKEFSALKMQPFTLLVIACILIAVTIMHPRIIGFALFIGYLISGPICTCYMLKRRRPKIKKESS